MISEIHLTKRTIFTEEMAIVCMEIMFVFIKSQSINSTLLDNIIKLTPENKSKFCLIQKLINTFQALAAVC